MRDPACRAPSTPRRPRCGSRRATPQGPAHPSRAAPGPGGADRRPGPPGRSRSRSWTPISHAASSSLWSHQADAAELAWAAPARRRRNRHGLGQVARLPAAGALGHRGQRGRDRAPAATPCCTCRRRRRSRTTSSVRCPGLDVPGVRADDVRRRLDPRGARLGAQPRELPAHQPRHAAPHDAAGARALGGVLGVAPLRRRRRVPPLPRRLRRARRADPPAAAAGRGALRRESDVRARVGDGGRAGRHREPADRRAGRGGRPSTAHRAGRPRSRCGSRRSPRASASTVRRYAVPRPPRAADLVADLVADGVRTLAFVRSRRGAETVALQTQARLHEVDPDLARRVAPYRGGYLPEDRRELEQQLREGELLAVAATNALELGIDIDGLDAVVMAGFPAPARRCGSRSVGPGGRDRAASACWSRATTRSTPTSSLIPRRCSAHPSRRPSSTPATPTSSPRTCAPPPRRSR